MATGKHFPVGKWFAAPTGKYLHFSDNGFVPMCGNRVSRAAPNRSTDGLPHCSYCVHEMRILSAEMDGDLERARMLRRDGRTTLQPAFEMRDCGCCGITGRISMLQTNGELRKIPRCDRCRISCHSKHRCKDKTFQRGFE